jgi:hypothetical protein
MMLPPLQNLLLASLVMALAANRGVIAYKIYQRRRAFQPRTFRLYFISILFIVVVLIVAVGLIGKGWYVAGALTSALCAIAMLVRDVLLGKTGRKDLDDHWVR